MASYKNKYYSEGILYRVEPDTLNEAMSAWRSGSITNWEYLMRLNGLGGRTYNDLMQYPVLPFVIADYTSRILDLNDPASFRDLSKPMAVQNKNREQHYINIYNVSKHVMQYNSDASSLMRRLDRSNTVTAVQQVFR